VSGPVLSIEAIDVFYGASQILFGVGLDVQPGQAMALLGRNGAGKSTTMKAIAGLAAPQRGHILFRGQDVTARKPYVMARQGLAYVRRRSFRPPFERGRVGLGRTGDPHPPPIRAR
jgi:branched-chain amino acid transport system ATP-binding protein